jgi:PPOX class F420-dependent enzyme/OxyR family protein
MFTQAEYRYLASHPLGRLASIGPDGAAQVHPVPFVVNVVSGCIEIEGPRLYETQKMRNIRRDPRVSLVVDDQASYPPRADGRRARVIEIRGAAGPELRFDVLPAMNCGDSSYRPAVSIGVHAAIAVGWSVVEVCAERLCRITVLALRRALMRATDLREGGCLRPRRLCAGALRLDFDDPSTS